MKKFFKFLFILLLVAFICIQFYPKAAKNESALPDAKGIATIINTPEDVQTILKSSCYDCHSNHTTYPWYANIQPSRWLLDDHIAEGKRELNFSTFANLRVAIQNKKLHEIAEQVQEGEMPLESYTFIHRDAKLTDTQKKLIITWAGQMQEQLAAKYPSDSLVLPKRPPNAGK